jgi:hypothetical protein
LGVSTAVDGPIGAWYRPPVRVAAFVFVVVAACANSSTEGLAFDCASYCQSIRDQLVKEFGVSSTVACQGPEIRAAQTCGACRQAFSDTYEVTFRASACQ